MTVNTWIGSSHLHFNPVTTPSPTESMAQDESSQKSVTCTAGAFVVSQMMSPSISEEFFGTAQVPPPVIPVILQPVHYSYTTKSL